MRLVFIFLAIGILAGCEDRESGLSNKHPGLNDRNIVVAFGDSITMGNQCSCVPYPARLSPMIGKAVQVRASTAPWSARTSTGRRR